MKRLIGPIYLDTSALLKLYLPEPGSDDLDELLLGRSDLQVSDLAITEFVSAVARRKREGELAAEFAAQLYQELLDQTVARDYLLSRSSSDTHRAAERILLSTDAVPLRAADSLHLALALSDEARTLATFDPRLRQAAPQHGLALLPG